MSNEYKSTVDQELAELLHRRWQTLHVYLPGGSTFLREITSVAAILKV